MGPMPQSLAESEYFKFHQTDLRETSAAAEVVASCKAAFGGRIDALLNIAGVADLNSSIDTLDEATWNRVIAVNLTAPVMLSKAVIGTMVTQGSGTITNVASKAGLSGSVSGVAYTASKHGLVSSCPSCCGPAEAKESYKVGATKNIAFRFRRHGIRCNAICPGGECTRGGMSFTIRLTRLAVATNIRKSVDETNFDREAVKLIS